MKKEKIETPPQPTYYLCKYDANLESYSRDKRGFVILDPLKDPIIPADMDRAGTYFIIEVLREFEIAAVVTYTTEEKAR